MTDPLERFNAEYMLRVREKELNRCLRHVECNPQTDEDWGTYGAAYPKLAIECYRKRRETWLRTAIAVVFAEHGSIFTTPGQT